MAGRGFGHALLRATNSLVAAFVDKVAVWYASFNWRTVVLAVTIAAQEACHTTNVLGPSARATTPGKWRLPFCGYIYWAIRLFAGSSIRRPTRILSSFLLPAALAMAASVKAMLL